MTKTRKWADVRGDRSPAEESQIAYYRDLMNLEGKLAKLRETAGFSQRALADILNVSQPNISRIEGEADLQVSTIYKYVEALGGRLEVRAVFDQNVEMTIIGDNDRIPA